MKQFLSYILALLLFVSLWNEYVYSDETYNLETAKHLISWQLDSGGWAKNMKYTYDRYWDGKEKKAYYYKQDSETPLGTIDNGVTIKEIEYIANTHFLNNLYEFRKSVREGIDFLLNMQYDSGGFPQVYPNQDASSSLYENDVTYNDDAMVNVLALFQKIINRDPIYMKIGFSDVQTKRINDAYLNGIEYILESQIVVDGVKTAWGGQHDPVTYETTKGREFEPISIISKESIGIIEFLETADINDPRIEEAIKATKQWLVNVVVKNKKFNFGRNNSTLIEDVEGELMWYRFYEISTNTPIFGDVDGEVHYDIYELSDEKRLEYGWAGNWGKYIYLDYIEELNSVDAVINKLEYVDQELETTSVYSDVSTFGKTIIDSNGIKFVESGNDSVIIYIPTDIKKYDRITIRMTISDTERETSELVLKNTGLRDGRSDWLIGHGTKFREINFNILNDVNVEDRYLEFTIEKGSLGEWIQVNQLEIYMNDKRYVEIQGSEEISLVQDDIVESEDQVDISNPEVITSSYFQATGNNIISDNKFTFVDGDSGYIKFSLQKEIKYKDKIRIEFSITESIRTDAELFIDNKGLRINRSDYLIGHGIKDRVIEFNSLKSVSKDDSFLIFEINGGNYEEYIVVEDLKVFVNGEVIE